MAVKILSLTGWGDNKSFTGINLPPKCDVRKEICRMERVLLKRGEWLKFEVVERRRCSASLFGALFFLS
jgi:hypothetical protein